MAATGGLAATAFLPALVSNSSSRCEIDYGTRTEAQADAKDTSDDWLSATDDLVMADTGATAVTEGDADTQTATESRDKTEFANGVDLFRTETEPQAQTLEQTTLGDTDPMESGLSSTNLTIAGATGSSSAAEVAPFDARGSATLADAASIQSIVRPENFLSGADMISPPLMTGPQNALASSDMPSPTAMMQTAAAASTPVAVAGSPTATAGPAATIQPPADVLASLTASHTLPSSIQNSPVVFEPNVGQTDPGVQFLAHQGDSTIFLTAQGATFEVPQGSSTTATDGSPSTPSVDTFAMHLLGANPTAQAVGSNPMSSFSNYFIGNNPSDWHTHVANYGSVTYKNVYPGIDLVYHSSPTGQLEYDFDVAPGTDPSQIKLTYQGVSGASTDAHGNLILQTSGGPVVQQAPVAYTPSGSARAPVAVSQSVNPDGSVSFQVGAHNPSQPLVIDPTVYPAVYDSSYFGGVYNDSATGIGTTPNGNFYFAGTTDSPAPYFPIQDPLNYTNSNLLNQTTSQHTPPYKDAFVAAFGPTGNLLWSSYLGGSLDDSATGLAVDPNGNYLVLVGDTSSTNFPTTSYAYDQSSASAFVTEINIQSSSPTIAWSTYFPGVTGISGVALDPAGNIYFTGTTGGNLPTQGAFQSSIGSSGVNAFVTMMNANGTGLDYSSYLGGSNTSYGAGIAVDGSGNAYVVGKVGGKTDGSGNDPIFPITSSALESQHTEYEMGFLSEVTPNNYLPSTPTGCHLAYSTFLGGTTPDRFGTAAAAVAVDQYYRVFVTGWSNSTHFYLKGSSSETGGAFFMQFDPNPPKNGGPPPWDTAWITPQYQDAPAPPEWGVNPFVGDSNHLNSSIYVPGTGSGTSISLSAPTRTDPTQTHYYPNWEFPAVILGGNTSSTSFQTTTGAFQTQLNGSLNDGFIEYWQTGTTDSQTTNPYYATYYGGTSASSNGQALTGVALGDSTFDYNGTPTSYFGNAYWTGYTAATDLLVTPVNGVGVTAYQSSNQSQQGSSYTDAFFAKWSLSGN